MQVSLTLSIQENWLFNNKSDKPNFLYFDFDLTSPGEFP